MSTEAPARKPLTPKAARELWAQALESGKYKQGAGQLAVETDEGLQHCCLGVACELAVHQGIIASFDGDDGALQDYMPVQDWLGLRVFNGTYSLDQSLTSDNDNGRTFEQIAATIRAEPEGLVTS